MIDEKISDECWVTVVATGYGDRPTRRSSAGGFSEPKGRAAGTPRRHGGSGAGTSRSPSSSPPLTPLCSAGARRSRSTTRQRSYAAAHERGGGGRSSADRGGGGQGAARRRQRVRRGRDRRACLLRHGEPAHRPRRGRVHARACRGTEGDHLLDFFVEAGGRNLQVERRADLVALEVLFDDVPQVFNVGPASCGVPGTAAGSARRRAAGARCRSAT